MNPMLEYKKLKRTALLPALILGGLLAAALPVVDLLVRADYIINPAISPLENLMHTDGMLIVMLDCFLIVLGACIVYYVEFADNAIQRINTLPVRSWSVFMSKFIFLAVAFAVVYAIEGASLYFCAWKWFAPESGLMLSVVRLTARLYLFSLPVLSLMLVVSSFCKNMWITLGIGVVGVFAALLLQRVEGLQYFPFLMPYQKPLGDTATNILLCIATATQTVLYLGAGTILARVRRNIA